MDPEFTESDSHDGVANLISVLRICEQIGTKQRDDREKFRPGRAQRRYYRHILALISLVGIICR